MRKVKDFDSLNKGDISKIIMYMDTDGDGSISMEELVGFLRTGYKPVASSALEARDKEDKDMAATPKQVLIQQLKRLSSSDGGLSGMLAHLDSDEDGLIPLSLLLGRLRKEGVFEAVSEDIVTSILSPMTSKGLLNIGQLMRFVESKGESQTDKDEDDEQDRDEFEGIPLVEYDFRVTPRRARWKRKCDPWAASLPRRA